MDQSKRHDADLQALGFVMVEERKLYWSIGAWPATETENQIRTLSMENFSNYCADSRV